MHDDALLAPPSPLREWRPVFPAGTLRAISLHWTAGDYVTVYPAYHFCIGGDAEPLIHHTHDVRANMRDLTRDPDGVYAAHTRGRNSYCAGIAACAMRDARPDDFGPFPLLGHQVEALCVVAARLVQAYAIPLDAVRTHAEAACDDGYFGAGDDGVRWDIARLHAGAAPLRPEEARATGDVFRGRIAALLAS